MPPTWREVIPAEDRNVYEAAGYGRRGTLGDSPALLVIDVTYGFIGREPLPILESIAKYPNSCGQAGWDALPHIGSVLDAARARNVPVYYTAGVTDFAVQHAGRWRDKHPKTLEQPHDAQEIPAEIAPRDGDVVIPKTKPSPFFGTPLLASLIDRRIDTLLVTGCTTSGCVRAAVVDAFSNGFSCAVLEEAVFDRAYFNHAVNLFDLDQKYSDVIPTAEAVAYLRDLGDP
jgi:maleamate amidohydrolase